MLELLGFISVVVVKFLLHLCGIGLVSTIFRTQLVYRHLGVFQILNTTLYWVCFCFTAQRSWCPSRFSLQNGPKQGSCSHEQQCLRRFGDSPIQEIMKLKDAFHLIRHSTMGPSLKNELNYRGRIAFFKNQIPLNGLPGQTPNQGNISQSKCATLDIMSIPQCWGRKSGASLQRLYQHLQGVILQ